MSNEQPKIPQATAKRLPLYYRFLKNLYASGKQRVSSAELSEAVKVDSATIRRDFSYFGALGKKGYGYNVSYLLSFFRKTLDQDEITEVALVGVGNLGTAFLNYNFMKNNNTKIVMAFDVDQAKVGTEVGGVPVYHLNQLEELIHEQISVAILTVPAHAAQSITDRLVQKGIKGILNFTPARLNVPENIRVHHIDLAIELQSLVYFLKNYPSESNGVNSL
ncbi:oxidoreductase, NAD-binding Rossmann fold family protein [Anoxybacillus sp. B7M1]|jgi:redox-sensing transcriptional repressor|uniref:Redox-sensing transcriptional repressor Rex n=1 Tax=Anoxybacteroides rupiense TaxID=311460 RepID=A0ABT5W8I6_9BACL|nr:MULTISPECIES: redox-sensing transcriptional repressor Rex [Anoxybacillus]ANB57070.1 oxidoreductase, NAD-binding Rossmann fold family protein [Anoxybacillus sp. B2M1]ANB63340.1 oxidoreductase, NAD-binding Rossmann fold family protein [Anoxybacillus sp. B7M1]KXG08296.1 Redox-sensing transcriptional repressor Rex [Anoxybacillus sp. P3H1B]MBB3909331.1 redox-sensing transcriptional repressor [Anoxybacillus rupiensis]MBS2773065.1 redox-sensing transcriptional repressor Rex [Anoxybacillus rupiensi